MIPNLSHKARKHHMMAFGGAEVGLRLAEWSGSTFNTWAAMGVGEKYFWVCDDFAVASPPRRWLRFPREEHNIQDLRLKIVLADPLSRRGIVAWKF